MSEAARCSQGGVQATFLIREAQAVKWRFHTTLKLHITGVTRWALLGRLTFAFDPTGRSTGACLCLKNF